MRRTSGLGPESLPPPEPAADEVRGAAEEILSRPEFQEPPKSLYQQALDKIGEVIGDVIGAVVGRTGGTVVAWLVIAVLVGLVVFLVVRGLQAGRRRRWASPSTPSGVDVDVATDVRRPPSAWDAEAARLEAAGDWRNALRCRYRSLVAALSGDGVVEEVPGRTAGEYRTLVRVARPALDEPFAGATDLFERAWYGNEPTGPSEVSTFKELAGRVRTSVR